MQPNHGARITLDLLQVGALAVEYELSAELPAASWRGRAAVSLAEGGVELAWTPEGPPAWVQAKVRSLLRSQWRRARDSSGWPRRVCRWRSEEAGRDGED